MSSPCSAINKYRKTPDYTDHTYIENIFGYVGDVVVVVGVRLVIRWQRSPKCWKYLIAAAEHLHCMHNTHEPDGNSRRRVKIIGARRHDRQVGNLCVGTTVAEAVKNRSGAGGKNPDWYFLVASVNDYIEKQIRVKYEGEVRRVLENSIRCFGPSFGKDFQYQRPRGALRWDVNPKFLDLQGRTRSDRLASQPEQVGQIVTLFHDRPDPRSAATANYCRTSWDGRET